MKLSTGIIPLSKHKISNMLYRGIICMFYVVNKDKIVSCLVLFVMVFVMFFMASAAIRNTDNVIETAGSTQKELPIYNVNTEEAKVALTLNSAWNADDIDLILETLEKHEVQLTFFVVGDWVERFPDAVKKIHEAGHEVRKSQFQSPSC